MDERSSDLQKAFWRVFHGLTLFRLVGVLFPAPSGAGGKEKNLNSREKGARGERELAEFLRTHGYKARRGQQFSGANGDADVVGLPGIHIECKRVEKTAINDWLFQAITDARSGEVPVVFHRQNHDSKNPLKGQWKVTLRADDFMELYKNRRGGE